MKKKNIIKITSIIFSFIFLIIGLSFTNNSLLNVKADFSTDSKHKSSVLIEKTTGNVLYENNSSEKLPIASVTKLMTILLTLEKIEKNEISIDDKVTVSENANGMGGSQIFLDANAEYELGELLKSIIVASANDSSVAIAEYISGSENNFVNLMNERANELGLKNTNYSNCTGLPTNDGYSSAYDQALVLREVLKHDLYHTYSSVWLEDFLHPSGRTTQMTNTNKLSRHYQGCIGGKTGSTNQAKYCLAVGAERNNMQLISVVLGAENSKERFKLASDLLNYGFSNFETKTLFSNNNLQDIKVPVKGLDINAELYAEKEFSCVVEKNKNINFTLNYNLPTMLTKINQGQIVGNVEIIVDGIVVDTIDIYSARTYSQPSIWDNFKEIISNI